MALGGDEGAETWRLEKDVVSRAASLWPRLCPSDEYAPEYDVMLLATELWSEACEYPEDALE